jgi:hypothetical protein
MWGGTWHANLDMGGEIATTGRVARILEEDNSVTAWIVHQEDRPLHHLQQQLWVWHVHVERTRNRATKCSRKWMGASWLERAEPHGGSLAWELSWLHAGRSCCWGPMWDWKRSTYVEAQHRAGNRWPKVNRGHATGAWWAPWAVYRDRCLHCTCCLNHHVDAIKAANTPDHSGFGEAALNWKQVIKTRLSWAAPSGLKWGARRMLAALSAHQRGALRTFLWLLLNSI